MKSLSLIVCLILTVGYLTSVTAVTDAELEALEKQIEQQEAEERKQAEANEKKKAEAKRRVEQKRKAEAEMEKKRLAEQKRLEEEIRKAEEARLAELERQRQEEEVKKRAEEERKEKYTLLIAEAEQAVSNKDKELAMSKYNEALALVPGDIVANTGIEETKKLLDKACYDILGYRKFSTGGQSMRFKENGTLDFLYYKTKGDGKWECVDSEKRLFRVQWRTGFKGKYYDEIKSLSEDGSCLHDTTAWGNNEDCWLKVGE